MAGAATKAAGRPVDAPEGGQLGEGPEAENDAPDGLLEAEDEGLQVMPDEGRLPEPDDPDAPLPGWAELPDGLTPPKGVQLGFLRIKSGLTSAPHLGDRTCVVWPLTDLDERLAITRIQGNAYNAIAEQAKQMVRAIDGVKVNWNAKAGEPGNLKDFWRDIGPKGRTLVLRYYNQTHNLSPEETADFLLSCVAVRTAT